MATKGRKSIQAKELKHLNKDKNHIDYRNLFSNLPGLYLILSPDLSILEANKGYLSATYSDINEIKGKNIFEAFPDNTSNTVATVEHKFVSLFRISFTLAVLFFNN